MFLRNAWYMAGWSETLTEKPRRIKLLGEIVVLVRLPDATPVALSDRCPHRFASLSDGKLVGEALQCPYHGLRFDRSGLCVFNPHGDGQVPHGARVKAYPLIERHRALWIWMGDAQRADEASIPDFSIFMEPEFVSSCDYLRIGANYQLVIDNLLDLSHAEFLHPFLGNPGQAARSRREVKQDGSTIWAYMWNDNEPITPLFKLFWDRQDERGDLRAHMRWTAPSNLLLDVGVTYRGEKTGVGPTTPSAHLLTPETESSTHYFWKFGRNRRQEDDELTKILHQGVANAFITEDEPMINRVAENLGDADFWDLKPIVLRGDAAAVRARRLLARLIREDCAARGESRRPAVHGSELTSASNELSAPETH